ncbi:MAG: hypothetical protein IKY94_03560, partial [Lachnospiraceae bacterium]|nr:hypothetical protein [Lachnospiraceae bacterium]
MERNYRRKERYQAIYDAFEPLRKAKKDTIHSIVSYGKKHPVLKYPVLLAAVAFIFVYNFFMHLFMQLHVREKLARGLALAMTVVIVITSVDVTAFAMKKGENQKESATILQIADLEEEILTQEIAVGESIEKVVFPDYLEVTVREEVMVSEEPTEDESELEEEEETEDESELEDEEATEDESELEDEEVTEDESELEDEEVTEDESGVEDKEVTEDESELEDEEETEDESELEDEEETEDEPKVEDEEVAESETQPEPEPEPESKPEPEPDPVAEPQPVAEPVVEEEEVDNAVSAFIDGLFQPMKVYAAEAEVVAEPELMTEVEPVVEAEPATEAEPVTETVQIQYKESVRNVSVTWELDTEKSSKQEFSSEKAGDCFVYTAVLEDSYILSDGVTMPKITVTIIEQKTNEKEVKLYEVIEVDGVAVEVSADAGVFPVGATVSILPVSSESVFNDVSDAIAGEKARDAERGAERDIISAYEEKIIAFDIT